MQLLAQFVESRYEPKPAGKAKRKAQSIPDEPV
jgi:hypothetical protein